MNKNLMGILVYVLFGVFATAIASSFAEGALAGTTGLITFGVLMTATVFAGNRLEPKAFGLAGKERADNMAWRIAIRAGLYLLLPAAVIVVAHLVAPSVILLPLGWRTVFQLVWMTMAIAAILRITPAR